MKRTPMFPGMPEKPRRKPQKLMHVIDAWDSCGDPFERGCRWGVKVQCHRCGHKEEREDVTATVAKRGFPCPKCNT